MLIAIKDGDRIVMAVTNRDSMALISERDYANEDNMPLKVIADKPGCFVGFAAAVRSADIFLCDDEFMTGEVNVKTLRSEIVPRMIKKCKEDGGDDDGWDNVCAVVCDGRIFVITPKWYVREEADFACCGANTEFLIGVLDSTVGLPAEARIRAAIDTYDALIAEDSYPLAVIDNKTNKTEIWRKK